MSADRVVTESPLWTCSGSTKTRGEMWFVFFAFEILLQKGSRTWGQSLRKKKPLGEFSLWPLPSQVGVTLLGDCLYWLEIRQYFKCKIFHRQLSNQSYSAIPFGCLIKSSIGSPSFQSKLSQQGFRISNFLLFHLTLVLHKPLVWCLIWLPAI